MMSRLNLVLLLAATSAVACASKQKPAETATAQAEPTQQNGAPQSTANDDAASTGNLNISDEIRRACGIPETSPFFAYNSAHLRGKDHPVLGQLAKCFSSGPLKGRTLGLVGHADPRGEHEFNLVLGERRADRVKGFLTTKGLSKAKVQTSSRGMMDAKGSDESGWAKDRRVDVLLAD